MLLQCAANYHVATYVLEKGKNSPAASLCNHFVDGDIKDYQTVYNFGKQVDVLTIEIEHVNLDALFKLEEEGLKIYPRPHALQIIKDKALQKQFYEEHKIPTAAFKLTANREDVLNSLGMFPVAQKLRSGGYDGKGVEILTTREDIDKAFDEPSVLEALVNIDKEISVIVAVNENNELAVYPPTEMVFNPKYNLVDYLLSPASISQELQRKAEDIAVEVVERLNSPGIFAVEMFLDKNGYILVNETAPRAHNSGHQSIEGNYCSQYDMQMRVLQNLPLGNAEITLPSIMLNLVGEPGHTGPVFYQGLNEVMEIPDVYIHLYGKAETKPGRKMGHVTILGEDADELFRAADIVKKHLKVISK